MHTVKSLAYQRGLTAVLDRAFSFHTQLGTADVWNIPVEFSDRIQTSAGNFRAKPRGGQIKLHRALEAPANKQPLDETFLHELAHAMQWLVYGVCDHSATWWEMMHQLGQKPRRTHAIAACKPAKEYTYKSVEELGL